MKKFSPPQMKEVSFPTPHTLFQVRRLFLLILLTRLLMTENRDSFLRTFFTGGNWIGVIFFPSHAD
ncbi:hypothetical protein MiTs_01251 [Microcystis aeruginosa NIES-2521]|uniref:Uncharacterized protein n=1 Tax=Microcystis aeruginosa NIES-2521 TaxID=2303983 RepID=A0A5A5S1H6_MICAE|nr:hypothetical protein MiTs_01251 [Microcystis aeruginosa NIES-2521]